MRRFQFFGRDVRHGDHCKRGSIRAVGIAFDVETRIHASILLRCNGAIADLAAVGRKTLRRRAGLNSNLEELFDDRVARFALAISGVLAGKNFAKRDRPLGSLAVLVL